MKSRKKQKAIAYTRHVQCASSHTQPVGYMPPTAKYMHNYAKIVYENTRLRC